jgi:eukaryotic-like serine/threonine-protein kinase
LLGAIAHYNLLERLGEGGLGEVYRARDTKFGRTVALKLTSVAPGDSPRQDRLLEDARAAASLSHPNIATLFDVGVHEGRLYLAYEFVKGTTIRHLMTGGPMNPHHALDIAVQVADALTEAHARGVVHKDLRPDTIVETGKGRAKVLDFGFAVWTKGGRTRALAAASPGSVAADAVMVVSYTSPEQARGDRVDARTDVFSLGVIVYEMLTGKSPFAGPDPATTLINITQTEPEAPSTLNPDLPKMVDVVLSRALTKDVNRRTQNAARLSAGLQRCQALLEPRNGELYESDLPRLDPERTELLPLIEERGGGALWWLLAALGAGLAAAVYYWIK